MAVIDLVVEIGVATNLIGLDPELCALFDYWYWVRVMPPDWHGDISLPFGWAEYKFRQSS